MRVNTYRQESEDHGELVVSLSPRNFLILLVSSCEFYPVTIVVIVLYSHRISAPIGISLIARTILT